jgi:glycosyltransferase involved in cell wall biosynthesis
MRVSLAMTSISVGGVWRNVAHLALGLQERGHEVRLGLHPNAEQPRSEARRLGVTAGGIRESLGRDADIWHLHLHNTYDPHAAVLIAARRALGSTVITEHLPHFNGSDRALEPQGRRTALTAPVKTVLKRASISMCDAVIIPSERVARFFVARYHLHDASRVHAIPLGVPAQRPAEPIPADAVGTVMASGSISVQKGFDLLVRAAQLSRVQWPLTILGDGPHRASLEAQLGELMHTRAQLPGWQEDPLGWLDRARVVCLPSRWETFPLAAVEAQLAARPVVAFAVDGIPEIVEHGVTGILVEPGDVAGLAGALDRLTGDRELAVKMGDAGHARASRLFALPQMVSAMESVYEQARSRRR